MAWIGRYFLLIWRLSTIFLSKGILSLVYFYHVFFHWFLWVFRCIRLHRIARIRWKLLLSAAKALLTVILRLIMLNHGLFHQGHLLCLINPWFLLIKAFQIILCCYFYSVLFKNFLLARWLGPSWSPWEGRLWRRRLYWLYRLLIEVHISLWFGLIIIITIILETI